MLLFAPYLALLEYYDHLFSVYYDHIFQKQPETVENFGSEKITFETVFPNLRILNIYPFDQAKLG